MDRKNLTTLTIFVLIISTAYFWYQDLKFPIKYTICDSLYENCFVHARFKDIDDCKMVEERQSWYCDQSNKQNITCEERDSEISASYCSK